MAHCSRRQLASVCAALLIVGCTGEIMVPGAGSTGEGGGNGGNGGDSPAPQVGGGSVDDVLLAPRSTVRRLTIEEYDNALEDILGDKTRSAERGLPQDARTPFDNDYTTEAQKPSQALVAGAEVLAIDAASRLLSDPKRRDALVGCTNPAAGDTTCFRKFLKKLGSRAFRRVLSDGEVEPYMALLQYGQADNDFTLAVAAAVRMFLQHPEFLYRVEVGTPVPGAPGIFRLSGAEVASRLSFLILGRGPSDDVLDRAARGGLGTAEQVRDVASAMLADPRAQHQIGRWHAMWLGYQHLAVSGTLAPAMQKETDALVTDVLFGSTPGPWQNLIRSKKTYVNYALCQHYKLTCPTLKPNSNNFIWLGTGGTSRRGLLSQGSFLALAGTLSDELLLTIRRGKMIRERLFCDDVPAKPPKVDSDAPPPTSPCKTEVMAAHRASSGCAACHSLMDPVGFGLDAFDGEGKERQYDKCSIAGNGCSTADVMSGKILTQCPIKAQGTALGQPFSGPIELGDLALRSPKLNECVVKQAYRFAIGRAGLDDGDRQLVSAMTRRLGDGDFQFKEMLVNLASSAAFRHRRVDDPAP